jgi:hypothetical protein
MGKNEKTPITVNDTEYFVDDMTDAQKTMLNHVNDLERKLANAQFNLDQLAMWPRCVCQYAQAQSLEVAEAEVVN